MSALKLPQPQVAPLRGSHHVRWGILAPGTIAADWAHAVRTWTDQPIVAVASRNAARADSFARLFDISRSYGSYDDLLADTGVDAVYIAAPHSEHAPLAQRAIAAGKHVLVEKPFATSEAEGADIASAASSAGVFAMEGMWSRFLPQTSILAQLLIEEELGSVRSVVADFCIRVSPEARAHLLRPGLGGGCLADLGVYPSWLSHFVLGPADSVTAVGTTNDNNMEIEAAVLTQHAGGATGIARSSITASSTQNAVISGKSAEVRFDDTFWSPGPLTLTKNNDSTHWIDRTGIRGRDGLAYEVAAMAAHIGDGLLEAPEHTLADTMDVLRVIDAARDLVRSANH